LTLTVACEIGAIPANGVEQPVARAAKRKPGDNAESAQWPSDRNAHAAESPITDL